MRRRPFRALSLTATLAVVSSAAASETAPHATPTPTPSFQYGIGLTTSSPISTGKLCDGLGAPCILSGGAGVAARVGLRTGGPWYWGGAYQLARQGSNNLYRLGILQELRGESRYYATTGSTTAPYASLSAGLAGYGNEWMLDTWGPLARIGVGLEIEITRRAVMGVALAHKTLALARFQDPSGVDRPAAIVQVLGLELVLEERRPL